MKCPKCGSLADPFATKCPKCGPLADPKPGKPIPTMKRPQAMNIPASDLREEVPVSPVNGKKSFKLPKLPSMPRLPQSANSAAKANPTAAVTGFFSGLMDKLQPKKAKPVAKAPVDADDLEVDEPR